MANGHKDYHWVSSENKKKVRTKAGTILQKNTASKQLKISGLNAVTPRCTKTAPTET